MYRAGKYNLIQKVARILQYLRREGRIDVATAAIEADCSKRHALDILNDLSGVVELYKEGRHYVLLETVRPR